MVRSARIRTEKLKKKTTIRIMNYHGRKEHNARHGNRLVILKLWQTEWGFQIKKKDVMIFLRIVLNNFTLIGIKIK